MRADRLIALVLFLQSRGKVTAAEVAAELDVSIPTARRDLEALSAAGVPVYGQPGRGGGWQLVGGARTNLTGLTEHESKALFWMLGTAGLSDPGTRAATRKLVHALPATLQDEAEILATRIHYDHTAWGDHPRTGERSEILHALRSALVNRRALHIRYTRRDGTSDETIARPLALVAKAGTWYLIAHPQHDDTPRTYRTDRISEAEPVDTSREQPSDRTERRIRRATVDDDRFDLEAFWTAHVDEVEALRSSVIARVRCPNWAVPILAAQFGRYFSVIDHGTESTTAEVGANLVIALAEQLAGWGRTVEVLSPRELRSELSRIGAELSDLYAEHTATTGER
ncbi:MULTISPECIES: helix-turn-helix transcriptional regulator [unclassified Brevibacterium]|uniref:helix-turn-helix transcriptional regulator n=1 Tax=unclassified Brevibacterium TaxID=2614124 RepID=UPI001091DC9E|nr:WYL domain-containing protein [Brevibacterium sp. S22]TGD27941.1 WYL domain-containing protein [Brevibacterium sp. S22]